MRVTYSQKEHEQEAEALDVLVRIAHPEWFAILCEYAEILVPLSEVRIDTYILLLDKVLPAFGGDLIQDFKVMGVDNPAKWWRENIAAIAARSTNETVLEAHLAYLNPKSS